jgi:hypothetical protein
MSRSSETVHRKSHPPTLRKDRSALGERCVSLGPVRAGAPHSKKKALGKDHEMLEGIMSDEFDGLDATEKAGIEAALNRCRRVAAQIASELRNKRHEHFVDKLALADFYASLEHAADVLGQKGRQPVENTPAPVEKGSRRGTVTDRTLSRA